jgi:hypothetical protein
LYECHAFREFLFSLTENDIQLINKASAERKDTIIDEVFRIKGYNPNDQKTINLK